MKKEKVIDKDFIRNFTILRKRAGLSMGDLAKKTGLSRSLMYYYSSGKNFPKARTLTLLCKALKCKKADFFKAE